MYKCLCVCRSACVRLREYLYVCDSLDKGNYLEKWNFSSEIFFQ